MTRVSTTIYLENMYVPSPLMYKHLIYVDNLYSFIFENELDMLFKTYQNLKSSAG